MHFPIVLKLNVQSIIFSKFLHETDWTGSYLFCYGAWAQKESAKLQNMRACTDKTGLSSIKLVCLIQKLDDRQIKRFRRYRQSRFPFPNLSRKDRSDSASRVPHEHTCQILTNQNIKIGRTAWLTCDHGKKRSSPPVFLKHWPNFLVRGQFEIKILIVRGHSDITQHKVQTRLIKVRSLHSIHS